MALILDHPSKESRASPFAGWQCGIKKSVTQNRHPFTYSAFDGRAASAESNSVAGRHMAT